MADTEEGTPSNSNTTLSLGSMDQLNKDEYVKEPSIENHENALVSYTNLGARPKSRTVEQTVQRTGQCTTNSDEDLFQPDIANDEKQEACDLTENTSPKQVYFGKEIDSFQQKLPKLQLPATKENTEIRLGSYANFDTQPKMECKRSGEICSKNIIVMGIANDTRTLERELVTNQQDLENRIRADSDISALRIGGQFQGIHNAKYVDSKENRHPKEENGEGGGKMATNKCIKKRGNTHMPITNPKHFLYIILEEMTTRTTHLKEFIEYRMGSDLNFTVVKTEGLVLQNQLIVLSFQSAKKASRGRSLLNKSNRFSQIKVRCFETENDAKGIVKDRTDDKLEVLKDIVRAAEKSFASHDNKLEHLENELKHLNEQLHAKKKVSLANFQNLSEQKPALEDKQLELKKQRNEFVNYIQAMKQKILEVSNKDYDKQMKLIRIAFGAECRRLEAGLPMYACREEILTTVRENQVCVVLGETGSGKSTQMVQYLYQAGYAEKGQIVCTQPRKIAASSLAQRVASEIGGGVGQETGYKVGMQAKTSNLTKILFVTDHILLNECLIDENLSKYSCIIIDEAHERSIFTDLLLGMLKKCLNKRPELKVIVTSATIDPGVFTEYFKSICTCPVLKVSGRVFPVDVWYEEDDHDSHFPDNYESKAVNKAIDIHRNYPIEAGDILVFLTAPLETDRCCEKFQNIVKTNDHQCLSLHGRLTPEQQQLVFAESTKGKRKIIFATNSAETSITIPGIRFVIDTGVCKEMLYDAQKNISSLCVVPISQSSANQRKGRAGRVSVGSCYRLYKETDYDRMDTIGKPEILRIHLAQGLLKLMEIGVNPLSFEFVQPPDKQALASAIETLEEIEAFKDGKITELGKWIAKLPVDPRLGALIKKGVDAGIPLETLVVAGFNNQKNIFFRVGSDEKKKESDMLKMNFCHKMGDVFTALNVYRAWDEVKEGSKGQWCKKNSINGKSMKTIRDNVKEIITILQKEVNVKIKYEFSTDENRDQTLHTLVFRNMMHNLCVFLGHEKAGYLTLKRKQRVQIHPSSSLLSLGMQPTWMVFGQLLRTSNDFITDVTPVTDDLLNTAEEDGLLKIDRQSFLAQQVKEAVKVSVGRQVYFAFVGPMHKKRRELEDTISASCNKGTIIIETNKVRGEISLFCLPKFAETAELMVRQMLHVTSRKLLLVAIEEPLSNDKSVRSIRAVIGQGGEVKDILMPSHYRSVYVKTKDYCQYDVTEEIIEAMLSHYGSIEGIWRQKVTFWGKVTFLDKAAAEVAVADMKLDENCDITLIPITFDTEKSRPKGYTVKLQWCRRPAKDHCFVYLNNPEDKPTILVNNVITINNNYTATVKPSKKDSDLMIHGLRPDVTEDVIRRGLLDALGLPEKGNVKRFRIIIPRQNVTSFPMETSNVKNALNLKIEDIVEHAKVRIDVREFNEKTAFYVAFLNFIDPTECEQVANNMIKEGFLINGKTVTVDTEFKSNVFVNRRVFMASEREILHFITTWNTCGHSSKVNHRELRSGNFSIDVSATSPRELANLKANVDVVVDGDVFECGKTKNLDKVFTFNGKNEMKRIEKNHGIVITVDERAMKVSVQGLQEERLRAAVEIHRYLEKIGEAKELEIQLKGQSNPPGLMRALLHRYGIGLKKLVETNDLVSVKLNLRYHEVTICGFEEGIKNTVDVIESIKRELTDGHTSLPADDMPDCPVCLCPIDLQDMCRLEYCGHAYCSLCLTSQVENAVHTKEFPMRCAYKDCGELLVIRDLTTQFRQALVNKRQLVDSAVSDFVSKNKERYCYCTTPDCKMIYAVTEDGELFSCPLCFKKLCTKCHKGYHDGLTCEMNESITKDGNSMLRWLQEKPDVRKLCPKCHTGIEKDGGCQHMSCKCGVHICWICMEYFSDSGKCYGHLSTKHGSFM